MRIKDLNLVRNRAEMEAWPEGKFLIDTVNAHSFVLAQRNDHYSDALQDADVLLPDGISIVRACRWLKTENAPDGKIAGADLFAFEMGRLEKKGGTCFFLGSSPEVLSRIRDRAAKDYPHIRVETYSPPFSASFSRGENEAMMEAVRTADPDLLWVGMTAPKQEEWLYDHWPDLEVRCHTGAIGAVFDFYAGTKKRAPQKWIDLGLEWLYRLFQNPRRLFKRYLVTNTKFMLYTRFKRK